MIYKRYISLYIIGILEHWNPFDRIKRVNRYPMQVYKK